VLFTDLVGHTEMMQRLGDDRGRGERKRPSTGWASLTPSELQVVLLVAEGLSNPQIGERLFISKRTVQTHLKHVFAKLSLTSRAELASEVTRRQA
jgi:DNA-binding CsgD family transcriptional regulator